MSWFKKHHIDVTYWTVFIALLIIAGLSIFSASSQLIYKYSIVDAIGKQLAFLLVGAVLAFCVQFVSSRYIRLGGYALLLFSLVCLMLISIPHSPFVVKAHDAARWMKIGGFSFQPSELAKLGLVIVVADLLSRIHSEEDKKRYFYITLTLTAVVVFPILLGNLSTALLIGTIVVFLWFLAKIPLKYIGSVIGILLVVMILGYFYVEYTYVKPGREVTGIFQRAETWVSRIDQKILEMKQPKTDEVVVTNANYQSVQAKFAVANGGTSPLGVGPGNSKARDFLPLAYMDYIYAIIVEESGMVGAVVLIFLYVVMLFRACFTSTRFSDYASTLMSMGLAMMLSVQALISMMVAVGLGPVTGQPLPLISMGGTGVMVTALYFGIMMGVSREQAIFKDRQHQTVISSRDDVPDIELEN
ncbi:MAG: FtsW/RodA/SpoVE family cell cycle protein [Paludibacteraceae bacterium]|nr:FtsW/RodA/SpoVE family cell cycle protein [Paludibacteraceae bacterium]